MALDERERLREEPFDYKFTKNGKAMIYFEGRQIMTLSEKQANKLRSRIEGQDDFAVQLALAKVTGNFKHGNER